MTLPKGAGALSPLQGGRVMEEGLSFPGGEGELITQAVSWGMSVVLMFSMGLALCSQVGGSTLGPLHFLGLLRASWARPSHAAAQRACPVHSAARSLPSRPRVRR